MCLLQGANGPAATGHKNCSLSLWGQCHPVILRILAQRRLSWGPQGSAGKSQEGEWTTSDQRQDVQWRGPTQWEYTVSIYASGSHWSVTSLRCGPGFLKGNLQSTPQEIKRNLLSSKRYFAKAGAVSFSSAVCWRCSTPWRSELMGQGSVAQPLYIAASQETVKGSAW